MYVIFNLVLITLNFKQQRVSYEHSESLPIHIKYYIKNIDGDQPFL